MITRSIAVAAIVATIVTAACTDGGDDSGDDAPSPSAVGATPTESASPSNTPTATLPDDLQAVVDKIVEGDAAALSTAFLPTLTECTSHPLSEDGLGEPPRCPDGVAEGSQIPIRRVTDCHRADEADVTGVLENFANQDRELYALILSPSQTAAEDWLPQGEHIVIVRVALSEAEFGVAFHVQDGQIVGVNFGCGRTAEQFIYGADELDVIFGPDPIPEPTPVPSATPMPLDLEDATRRYVEEDLAGRYLGPCELVEKDSGVGYCVVQAQLEPTGLILVFLRASGSGESGWGVEFRRNDDGSLTVESASPTDP